MGTLFLIGNGFDANCGMKTKYKDMYPGYISSASSSPIISEFKNSISSEIDNWGDFEMSLAEYAGHLKNEEELLECIRDFNVYLNKYLSEEQEKFKKRISDKTIDNLISVEMGHSFRHFYDGITHNLTSLMDDRNAGGSRFINAISFNYTDVFDILYNDYKYTNGGDRNVIHIHGKLNDDPFLGVDNIDQIKADYSLSYKTLRTIIKPISNEVYDENRVKEAKRLIMNSNTICTFGMSLGESDLTWRNELINWLKENPENHLFIYKHSLFSLNYGTVMERLDKGDSVRDQLLLDWGIQLDNPVLERIHIPCGKRLFDIKRTIEEAESKISQKKKIEDKIEEFKNKPVSEL